MSAAVQVGVGGMEKFARALGWARSQQFPSKPCEHHRRATEELWGLIEPLHISSVLDIGAGESYGALRNILTGNGIMVGSTDIIADNVEPMDAHDLLFPDGSWDLVVARHMLEHVLAPYIVLGEMVRVSSRWLLVIVPEDIARWRYWGGHLHVLPRRSWEVMFWLLRLRVAYFGVGDFSQVPGADHDLEWRWILEKGVLPPLQGHEWNGYYPGPWPELAPAGWQE